jgi:cytochrome c biogenesis protein
MISLILKRIWHFLAQVDVAAILIAMLLLLAALGSCFPQQPLPVATSPERQARWLESIESRYGALASFVVGVGFTQFFRSPLFLLSLALLGTATLVCTLNRWRATWRRAFYRGISCPDATFEVATHAAKLTTLERTGFSQVLQGCLEKRGFRVRQGETNSSLHLRADRYRLGALATLVSHLGIPLLLLGAALSGLFAWRETLTIRTDEPISPSRPDGVVLQLEEFTIERYPDGSAAAYQARVRLIQASQKEQGRLIRVNEPLKYEGVSYHLVGFEHAGSRDTVILLAVSDPGYGLVILAGFMLLVGMTISFNFPHCCVFARLDPDGVLHLAGRVDRRAYDFEREFLSLVEELESTLELAKGEGGSPG